MTRFLNGPAQGQRLMLRRAPIFLRVVEVGGKWDALDQVEDTPAAGESIHVYRLAAKPCNCHIYKRGGGGGFFTMADYQFVSPQPADLEVRDLAAWRAWCQRQPLPQL